LIAFSAINTSKVTFKAKRGALGNLWCFAVGAIGTLIGQRTMDPANPLGAIKSCIPAEWGGSQGTPEENQGMQYVESGNSIVKTILNWEYKALCKFGYCVINLSTDGIVEKVCSYADQVISALGGRRFRRRFFLQRSAKSQKNAIAVALNKVWRTKGKRIDFWGYIKEAAGNLLRPIFTKLKDWFVGLIERIPIVKKIMNAFNCLKTLGSNIVQTVKDRITGFGNAINSILTKGWAGFIKVIIKGICQWSTFKQAILDLVDAFANQGCKRWNLIGRCIGGIGSAIADGNK
jgi:hypothetical protein